MLLLFPNVAVAIYLFLVLQRSRVNNRGGRRKMSQKLWKEKKYHGSVCFAE